MKLSLKRSLVLPVMFAIAPLCAMPNAVTTAPAINAITSAPTQLQQNQIAPQAGFMTRVANHVYRNADIYGETAASAISLGIMYFWIWKPEMEKNRKFYESLEKIIKAAIDAGISLPKQA